MLIAIAVRTIPGTFMVCSLLGWRPRPAIGRSPV
jgi:hypothetical protein